MVFALAAKTFFSYLEHKEVWQSLVVILVIVVAYGFISGEIADGFFFEHIITI
jgi:hypothetical protein